MIIGKCRNKLNFILNDSVIENVTFYKYLGVFFQKNGKFTYCMKQLVQTSRRNALFKRVKVRGMNLFRAFLHVSGNHMDMDTLPELQAFTLEDFCILQWL